MHEMNYQGSICLCRWSLFMMFDMPSMEMEVHKGKISCGQQKYKVIKKNQNPEMSKLLK